MRKYFYYRVCGLVFYAFLSLIVSQNSLAADTALNRIVAVVNEAAITQSQLDYRIAEIKRQYQQAGRPLLVDKALRQQVLDQMIDFELQKQRAANIGMVISAENLDKAIADIAAKNNLTLGQLKQKLQEQGMSWEKYRQEIHNQILTNELQRQAVGQDIVVSDQDVEAVLQEPAFKLALSEYHLLGVLVPVPAAASQQQIAAAKQQAQSIANQLKADPDWRKVLNEASTQGILLQAGDLGWRKAGEFPEFIAAVLPTVKNGQLAGPLLAPNGFHVLKVLGVREGVQKNVASQYQVRHILLKTDALQMDEQIKQRLLTLRQEILNGQDFAKVAEKYSQDPVSAGKGGNLGWVSTEMLDPNFAKTMEQLKPGQISLPVKSTFGWHLIQVLDRKQEVLNAQQVKRNQAKQVLYKKKADEAIKKWLQDLRKDAYIKITL